MRYHDIVVERMLGTTQLVYHSTTWADEIIRAGGFEGKTICRVGDRRMDGTSFTRSKHFATQYSDVIFGMDFQRLKTRFKVIPFADDRISIISDEPGDYRREAEEFVAADFIPLEPYLAGIWINASSKDEPEYARARRHKLYRGTFRPQ